MYHNISCSPEPAVIDQPGECSQDKCTRIGCQYVDISVPSQLSPHTTLDNVEIECCGEPTVSCQENCCKDTVEVVITQKVRVKFPIRYTVTACMGESVLECASCEEARKPQFQ